MEVAGRISLENSSLSPDILELHLALPSVCTSQVFYPESIVNVVRHYDLFHLVSTSSALLFITHLNISYANCIKSP